MPENYCIYLRKSRADLEAEARGEGETLARHQATLLELAKRKGLNVIKIYKEIVSGDSIAARPQMQAMLSDITSNLYSGVLVMEVERLARGDTIDQGVVAQAFKQSGTKIITPFKTYDPNNEFDEEYFEFSLFMSRREYKTIKRRMQAGRLAAVKEGNYICSRTPYGYRKISPEPKVHTLEIVPEEAEVVKMIFQTYLEGHGAKYIAAELNRLGIPPQKSKYWESPSIKKILSNPLYCGKLQWQPKNGSRTVYEGRHEAIIPVDVFEAAQYKKKNNPATQIRSDGTLQNYYHGVIYCKNCGHQMKRRFCADSGYEHLLCVYRECQGKVVSSLFQSVDELLLASFRLRLSELESLAAETPSANKPPTVPDKLKPLRAELEKAKGQQSRLYDLLEQGIYDVATFVERSKLITARIDELEHAISEAEAEKPAQKLSPQESIMRLKNVIENFNTSSPEQKNTMLKSVVSKVYYSKSQRMCRRNLTSDLVLDIVYL